MDGLKITFEMCDNEMFVHIWLLDGKPFGKAAAIRDAVPAGAWITVPPEQQPGITWYLMRHCGFDYVTSIPVDGVPNDVLLKVD